MQLTNLEQLNNYASGLMESKLRTVKTQILVSMGTCGIAAGATPVLEAFKKLISDKNLTNIEIIPVGCVGLCYCEPTVEVLTLENGKSVIFGNVKPEDADNILKGEGSIVPLTWYFPEESQNIERKLQARIVLRNSGRINPESIEEYIMKDGYQALFKALSIKPEDVIKEVIDSGLRGRGGGGFPTGRKWSVAAEQNSDEKFLICNADEGDPGAFMDRAVMEGDPHAVVEGMIIAGYAIGASQGIIYVRAEYPLAVHRLNISIEAARKFGFLGKNILNSGFDFDLYIKYGAGAFVCGEETALIRSIEGTRGMPVYKPPFPAVEGLWGKPTIVNNVETLANVPAIFRKGPDWFKSIGTAGSPGTKVFSITGKVNNVGLIEVPMGITLREIVFSLGGGIGNGRKFKAVQTGGPSGGCIAEENLGTSIDYDTLKSLDSMMGSGGMIVMDEDDCMVSIAKFFIGFTMDESCGKCTPCRVGGKQLFNLLEKITDGKATMNDLTIIKDLSVAMKTASLCGLGTTAPNPVLSTIKYFENEYLDHIENKHCVAAKCEKLIQYIIDDVKCIGCTACAKVCPVNCISGKNKSAHKINQDLCIKCGACYEKCKFDSIIKK